MPLFAVETETSLKAERFMSDTNIRIQRPDLVSSPFTGFIRFVNGDGGKAFYIVDMAPIWPCPIYGAFLGLLVPVLIRQFISSLWVWIPGVFLLSISFFWTSSFFTFMLGRGLKKAGYSGPLKRVSGGDAIRKLVECTL